MNAPARSVRLQNSLVVLAFHFLLFAYPLISFLWRRSYPLITVETGILFVVIFVFSALLSIILAQARPTVANVLSSLLITAAFMVQFNLLLVGIALCIVICLIIAWQLKTKFYLLGLPVLVALMIGALLDSMELDNHRNLNGETAKTHTELPPVIHILLDAFAGIDGLPPYPASEVMKHELDKFFESYGFQVFPRAYSRYSLTGDSLYAAMNFKNDGDSEFSLEVTFRRSHVLQSNLLFDTLENLGYRINIYQTQHLDFCQSNPRNLDKCWAYAHPYVASLRYVQDLHLRVSNLAGVLLKQSTLLSDMFQSHGWFIDMGIANHDPQIFVNLQNDILAGPEGRYFFAHVLLPHGPFAYLHDCSINYATDSLIRFPALIAEGIREDLVYQARTGMYLEQMECSLMSVSNIFDNMKQNNLFEKSIIIIHGDHGALIGEHLAHYENRGKLTQADYRSNFSTLFAVKLPAGKFQVSDDTLPLSVLLESIAKTVQDYATNQLKPPATLQISTDDPNKLDPYVFLTGTYPLFRVDVDIFER